MKNIIDQMTEPRFKQMMVKLSKATTDKEVDDIISEHNQIEMSDANCVPFVFVRRWET